MATLPDDQATFSVRDARRIAAVVRWYESHRTQATRVRPEPEHSPRLATPAPILLKLTSTTADGNGWYPCQVWRYDGPGPTYTALGTGHALVPNGTTVDTVTYYEGLPVWQHTDGLPVYAVFPGGGGAGGNVGVDHNGTLVGTRPTLNFIDGSNVTLTVADNAGSNRVDITIAATGGGTPAAPSLSVQYNNAGVFGGNSAFNVDPVNLRLGVNMTATANAVAVAIRSNVDTDASLAVLAHSITQTAPVVQCVVGTAPTLLHVPASPGLGGGSHTALNQNTVSAAALSVTTKIDSDEVIRGVANSATATGNLLDLSVPGTAVSCTMSTGGVLAVTSDTGGNAEITAFGGAGGQATILLGQDANNGMFVSANNNSGQAVIISGGVYPGGAFDFIATSVLFDLVAAGRNQWVFRYDNSQDELFGADFTSGTSNNTPQGYVKTGFWSAVDATHQGYIVIGAVDYGTGGTVTNPYLGAGADRDGFMLGANGTAVYLGFFTKATLAGIVAQQAGDVATGLVNLGLFSSASYTLTTGCRKIASAAPGSDTVANQAVLTNFATTLSMPANTVTAVGQVVRVKYWGTLTGSGISVNASNHGYQMALKIGTTVVWTSGNLAWQPDVALPATVTIEAEVELYFSATGVTGACVSGLGQLKIGNSPGGGAVAAQEAISGQISAPGSPTVDTTAAQTLQWQVAPNVIAGGGTMTAQQRVIYAELIA